MILKIAWRNIWRNKRRSLIVLSSIVVSIAGVIFYDGLNNGMLNQMLFNQINTGVSHIQIHKKGFKDNKTVKDFIPDHKKVEEVLKNNQSVKFYSERVIVFGLLSSAVNSTGVFINGIEPSDEEKITIIRNSVIQGNYPDRNNREILIGKSLAEKLGVGAGDKLVALSNTQGGMIGSDVFRISGVFETASSEFDKINVYIPVKFAQQMLEIGDNVHEVAIITTDYNSVKDIKETIRLQLGDEYEVLDYTDILPLLISMIELYKETMVIVDLIFGTALIFGIANVMLMAVIERIREFGVLRSIGMKSSKLFLMIIMEALIIGITGTVTGLITGILINIPFFKSGINLSLFAEGLKSFGTGAVIYPVLSIENLISLAVMVPLISVLAAIYPAYKSIKLEPVDAIRHT